MELQIAKNDGLYKVLTLKFNEPLVFFYFRLSDMKAFWNACVRTRDINLMSTQPACNAL